MFFEEQAEWNKKYLTYNMSEKDKQRGYMVPSLPHTYSVSNYYECFPNEVLKSTRYKEAYLKHYEATETTLTSDMISEDYYIFLCNEEILNQVDYDEHCSRLHGVCPAELTKEQNIRVDSKLPFTLESAMDIESVGPDDHDNILGNWYFKGV